MTPIIRASNVSALSELNVLPRDDDPTPTLGGY